MTNNELVIEPYFRLPAACHDYDPRSAEVASRLSLMITQRQPLVAVEHIGSSSVPGCAGKGNIDLMLLYSPGNLAEAKQVLADLGFQRQLTPMHSPKNDLCA